MRIYGSNEDIYRLSGLKCYWMGILRLITFFHLDLVERSSGAIELSPAHELPLLVRIRIFRIFGLLGLRR